MLLFITKTNYLRHFSVTLFFAACCLILRAQSDSSRVDKLISFPDKFFSRIDKKAEDFQAKLQKQTERYLSKLERREEKLKRKLWKTDSTLAKELFGNVKERYDALRSVQGTANKYSNVYSPRLDSLNTALNFINTGGAINSEQLNRTLSSFNGLQEQLNASQQVKKQLLERQKILRQKFEELGMTKQLNKFRKDVFYYQQQLRDYKQAWEDPSILEAKLMSAVRKLPAFKDFFAKHSQLASLFPVAGSSASSTASFAGLQSRASIQQALVNQFGTTTGINRAMQQNVQSAQAQLNQLKTKLVSLTQGSFGNGADNIEMPNNFRPNTQKTKSFLERIELGANFQSQKARSYFPVTADLGLSAGYKLNDKSIIGVGLAYKAGLGSGWRHIALSHQGIGLRSFLDYKLIGSFSISGGYEQNYLSQFNRLSQLSDQSAWQSSGLVGLSKKYKVSKKLKGEVRLLWDFLSYRQTPVTQPFVFRFGYAWR